MPPTKAPKNASAAAAVGGRDHISNLPEEVLQHLLSFVPAQDAVRTCVLAKRWRHLWKSTTGLRFVCDRMKEQSLKDIQDFVDHLLRLRLSGGMPLDTCELRLGDIIDEDDRSRIILWIRIALQCKVRVLQLTWWVGYEPHICPRDDPPIFISQYLKMLELGGLESDIMPSRFLDFSYCPVLEDLKIVCCNLSHTCLLISSQSLKRLTIERCYFTDEYRMTISAPNLVSLWLEVVDGRTPLLQRMPSLITAYVKINSYDDSDSAESEDDDSAKSDDDYSNQSILLHGLSEVRNLSLKSWRDKMFIFRRNLKIFSSFNNLKSLLLDAYWCTPADFSALACLLKLCPVLEKLTLELYSWEPKYKVETKMNCNPWDISAEVSRHLKIVEVKSQVCDEKMINILTFLNKHIFQGRKGSA